MENNQNKKNILVIGAGAVGAVYGRHLQLGGANVTFYVRPKYRADVAGGIDMLHYNNKKRGVFTHNGFSVVSSDEEVAASSWDQVYVTISSPALRSHSFVNTLAQVNRDAILVILQSGVSDLAYMQTLFPADRIVQGLISLISYQAPLAGEDWPKCIAYWFPPGSPNPFSGPELLVNQIIPIFKNGHMPVKKTDSVQKSVAFATGYFMPFLAALELSHWNFAQLKKSGILSEVDNAAAECYAAIETEFGLQKPWAFSLLKSPLIRMAMIFQGMVMPFDLEVYFKYHFLKVREQTVSYLREFLQLTSKHKLPGSKIRGFVDQLEENTN